MPIRNRLIPLIYRIALLGIGVCSIYFVFSLNPSVSDLAYFGTESLLFSVLVILLEVINNAIDLGKNGKNGVPAGLWMPLTLAALAFTLSDSLCYIISSSITGTLASESNVMGVIFSHFIWPIFFLIDYILFDEKGTVKWRHAFFWLAYPVSYFAFTITSHFIFQSDFFPYKFLNNEKFLSHGAFLAGNNGWNGVMIALLCLGLGFTLLDFFFIFLNNLLSGRYKKHK